MPDQQIQKLMENRIAKFRRKIGITQKFLSAALGISESQVKNYEAQSNQPSLNVAIKLCEYFNTTPKKLFKFKDL